MEITLAEVARRFGLEFRGDPGLRLNGVCTLEHGHSGCLTFLADRDHEPFLASTRASAVVLKPEHANRSPAACLLSSNPHLAFAKIAAIWDPAAEFCPGIDSAATVHVEARVDAKAAVCAGAIIQAGTRIAAGVYVGPGCVIGRNVEIGADSRLAAGVTLMDGVRLGKRVRLEPGAIIGGRGFGLARDGVAWAEVPQLGSVGIGDDVEVGANSTIDRGAIEDTIIENGVKIDSQVHVAHNCRIGEHTVIAGCVGIAGSVTIGKRCILAGGVGVADHLAICDDVTVTGMSMVTRDIEKPGTYSSGWGATAAAGWRRQVAALRRLPESLQRLKALEKLTGRREKK